MRKEEFFKYMTYPILNEGDVKKHIQLMTVSVSKLNQPKQIELFCLEKHTYLKRKIKTNRAKNEILLVVLINLCSIDLSVV